MNQTILQKMMFWLALKLLALSTKADIATFYRNARPTKMPTHPSKFTKMIGLSTVMQDAVDSTSVRHSLNLERKIRKVDIPLIDQYRGEEHGQ